MQERRASKRISHPARAEEKTGEFLFHYSVKNLGESGLYLQGRLLHTKAETTSKISVTLPNGARLHQVPARIVREDRKGPHHGSAFEFLQLTEEQRMELKRCFSE
jgi:hypothetical protein